MIWWLLIGWSVWGAVLCILYGQRVVMLESDFRNVLFAVACGPAVWLAIGALWIWDRFTRL